MTSSHRHKISAPLNKQRLSNKQKALPLLAGLLLLSTISSPVFAQDDQPQNEDSDYGVTIEDQVTSQKINQPEKRDYLSISVENDVLGGGTDQFYTSGVRLTYFNSGFDVPDVMEDLDDFIPTFDVNTTTSTFYTIGQNLYTPEDITVRANQDDDRPWAGFLYGSIGLMTVDNNHFDELELTLGVVGPPAFGEQTQKFVHSHVTSSPTPKGWSNQLDFEPGLILSWQRRWPRAFRYDLGNYRFRAEPSIGASIGNIYTYAETGLMFSFSPDRDIIQDAPPRVRPAMPGSGYFDTPDDGWSWQLFAGATGRAVGRNIFLDGNTFKDSHSVDKNNFVGDLTGGLAFTLGDYRLAYSINYRSDEFKNQSDDSVFGSLTLSTRF